MAYLGSLASLSFVGRRIANSPYISGVRSAPLQAATASLHDSAETPSKLDYNGCNGLFLLSVVASLDRLSGALTPASTDASPSTLTTLFSARPQGPNHLLHLHSALRSQADCPLGIQDMPASPPWAQEAASHIRTTTDTQRLPEHDNSHPSAPRSGPRKPTPSPLQVSESFSMTANGHGPNVNTHFTAPSSALSSPHSPRSPTLANQDHLRSPRACLEELITSEASARDGPLSHSRDPGSTMSPASAPVKTSSYHQLRNISSPIPLSKSLGSSPPASPVRTASTPFASSSSIRPDLRSMPRTSSIDSAISTLSSATSHSHKSSQDSNASTSTDISHLISTAGSAEALIQHLLREKQHSTVQNTQLWKLVDKQRTLVLGLNQDLERALEDKERYRRKLKEHLVQVPPVPASSASNLHARASSGSSIRDSSSDRTPVQRSKDRETVILDPTFLSKQKNEGDVSPRGVELTATSAVELTACRSNQDIASDVPSQTAPTDSKASNKPERRVAPIRTTNLTESNSQQPHDSSYKAPVPRPADDIVSPNSFTRKRSLPFAQKAIPNPSLQLTESTPPTSASAWGQPLPRKLPPAPLNLRPVQKDVNFRPGDHSESEYEENVEVDELPGLDRGRKQTREEDDREREAALLRDQENRSRSKKSKGSKPPAEPASTATTPLSMPSAIKSVAPAQSVNPENSGYLTTPASLAGVLSPSNTQASIIRTKTLNALPISPGLPVSPRPIDRPLKSPMPRMPRDGLGGYGSSPPLSPRNGFVGLPLSPRAPRQPIPMPPHTPMSLVSPAAQSTDPQREPSPEFQESGGSKESQSEQQVPENAVSKKPTMLDTGAHKPRGIFRGFVSESYPDLLIPPNALPSISVRVNSSRLKPSRVSYLGHRGSEEEPVFTLGISARSDLRELWQVEKTLMSLPPLDHQIKKTTASDAKLPDRSLFSGHAPTKVDARRAALERYFEAVLDTPMDEKAAVALCRYLSAQAIEPTNDEIAGSAATATPTTPVKRGSDGRLVKEGYLTKRGKNFGGWKARFFVLDEPILRYYESPGGALLGTIKLQNAQIGKQSTHPSSSPPRGGDDSDNQYRHAFLILEPKRKDSNSYVRHVLCAESDAERDVWVEALLYYVEEHPTDERARPPMLNTDSGSSRSLRKHIAKKDGANTDSPESVTFEGLQALSYDNTLPAQPPVISVTPQRADAETPSPPISDNASAGRVSQAIKPISGPSNGAKIEDAGAWGNKVPQSRDVKEPKKRGIWGFRDKTADLAVSAEENRTSYIEPPAVEMNPSARPTFGVPLAEAVEFCPPRGVDVCLPAVVYRCLEYLEAQDAASEEGIFRLSGSSVVIKALRDRFNYQGDFDFLADGQYYDVHAVASLLKLYLRELPSIVLTRELHLEFLAVLDLDSKPKKIAAYSMLVHRLPKANWTLIRALSSFLIGIVNNSEVNKMSVRNVGIVFSPTLNIPAPIFSMFLMEFDAIFGEDARQAPAVSTEAFANEPLTPEEIRSPRRQMFSEIPTPSYSRSSSPPSSNHEQPSWPKASERDTGFAPLHPSYEGQVVPGPEPSTGSRNMAPEGAVKARRRESSMLLMSGNHRKSSMPLLSGDMGQ
ncbi:MAG: hypothetical protein Q9173_000638 [Seirophora scorigena]